MARIVWFASWRSLLAAALGVACIGLLANCGGGSHFGAGLVEGILSTYRWRRR